MQEQDGYTPHWPGEIAGYAVKFAKADHWKVQHDFADLEDLVQECAWVFARCAKHFRPLAGRGESANRALFMAFYKRCLQRYLIDLAKADRRHRLAHEAVQQRCRDGRVFDVDLATWVPVAFSEGPLNAAVAAASRELRQVLRVIDKAPPGLLDLLLPATGLPATQRYSATLSRSWCRLARTGTLRNDLVAELHGLLE